MVCVGGNESKVGERRPMIVKTIDTNGNLVFLVDPAGVFNNCRRINGFPSEK